MTGSPYITVPDPGQTPATQAVAVQALKHNMNLLIANNDTVSKSTNLVGSDVFALKAQVQKIGSGLQGQQGDPGAPGPAGPPGPPGADAPTNTYLPLAGGTMTGNLTISSNTGVGVVFQNKQGANAGDVTNHIQLYSATNNLGIGVTSGRINYNHNAAGDQHVFRTGNIDRLSISSTIRVETPMVFSPLPPQATNDANAATAGVAVGGVYCNGSVLMVRVS